MTGKSTLVIEIYDHICFTKIDKTNITYLKALEVQHLFIFTKNKIAE